jgi:colanic acid biosynthesis glycosyl transferase WcaI
MRLLIIGDSYAPEETGIAPYTTGLAEHLVTRNHDVTVATGMPSYPEWRIRAEYRGMLRAQEIRGGVEVRRVRGYVPRRQSMVHRGLYEGTFVLGGLTTLKVPRPDVVLGVVPALGSGVLARIAARSFGRPYGLIVQDLAGPACHQSGMAGDVKSTRIVGALEGWAVSGAKAVGIIAEAFRPYLESLGVDPACIHRVRNWAHVEQPRLAPSAVRERLGLPADAVVCLHAGNMGYKQGLENVIQCARLAAEENPRLLFVLMGDGNQRPMLMDLAQRLRLANLRFVPVQPAELFSSVLAAANVLLVNQRGSVTNMSLPSKLTSYFVVGRPVVAAASPASETAREVRESGAGVLVRPDRPRELLDAVRHLVADRAQQERLIVAARNHAQRVLHADAALAALEALVHQVAGQQVTSVQASA